MSMLISLSLAAPQKRLNKEQFLKLAKQAQGRYLERFPRSTHRFLIPTKPKVKAKPARLPKAEPAAVRRLSKTEYEALNKKGKARYDERFPKSKHRERFRTGNKPDLKRKKLDGKDNKRAASKRSKDKSIKVDAERNTMHDEGAGTINKQSVNALANIRTEHLRQGAANINNNRDEIHDLVDQEIQRRPNLFDRGLDAVRDMMNGDMLDDDAIDGEFEDVTDVQAEDEDGNPLHDEEGKPITRKQKKASEDAAGPDPSLDEGEDEEEETPADKKKKGKKADAEEDEDEEEKERKKKKKKKKKKGEKKKRDGMAIAVAVAKFALLGAGVTLLAMGAGPLGMIVGRGLVELWSNMESTAADKTPEELNHDTVDELITQTASYLKNMTMDDLHESSGHMFKAIAATPVDIYNECFSAVLPLVSEKPIGRRGKNFFGSSVVDAEALATAIRKRLSKLNVLREFEHTVEDGDDCYMFFCNDGSKTLVALGSTSEDGLYHVAFLNW